MNLKQKFVGFCLAVLFGIINISSALAEDKPLFNSSSEDQITSGVIIVSPQSLPLSSIEDVVREISLPEYSEDNFHHGNFIHCNDKSYSEKHLEQKSPATFLKRDLKQVIQIQLFPFHFFL